MNCRRQRFLAHWRASPADGRPRAVSAYRPPNDCYGYNPPSSWSRRRNGDRWRGDEGRNLGSILRADADRVDRFRLAVVEDCQRLYRRCSGCRARPASFAADQDRASAYDRGQCILGTAHCDEVSCRESIALFRRSAGRGVRADESPREHNNGLHLHDLSRAHASILAFAETRPVCPRRLWSK
jgi:hypothetical protein